MVTYDREASVGCVAALSDPMLKPASATADDIVCVGDGGRGGRGRRWDAGDIFSRTFEKDRRA
jgi:hypothetical protein